MRIALTGNPNSGKTTMYNGMTDKEQTRVIEALNAFV